MACMARAVAGLALLTHRAAGWEHLARRRALPGSKFDPNRILCPVLAAMYKAGDLHPDADGSVTLEDCRDGLAGPVMTDKVFATFQATGIADFNRANKASELYRERCIDLCLLGTCIPHAASCNTTSHSCCTSKGVMPCGTGMRGLPVELTINGSTYCCPRNATSAVPCPGANTSTDGSEHWFNLFTMNGNQMQEHGFSTGVRGGASNGPEFDYTGGPCNGTYPCEERFQKFYASCADSDGRFYAKNVQCVICNAQQAGDRSGEFSFNGLQTFRQWQPAAAFLGWLAAFGRIEPGADPHGPDTYFEMEDVRAMIMEGRYPDGWKPRYWGNMSMFETAATTVMPCADKDGYYAPWWQGTACESATGQTCGVLGCDGGAVCLERGAHYDKEGRCVCPRGANGVSMCAVDGKCVEREDKCTYFGEPCKRVAANGPDAPW